MKTLMLAVVAMAAVSGTAWAETAPVDRTAPVAASPKRTPPALVKRDTTAPDKDKLPYLLPTKTPEPSGDDGSTSGKSTTE